MIRYLTTDETLQIHACVAEIGKAKSSGVAKKAVTQILQTPQLVVAGIELHPGLCRKAAVMLLGFAAQKPFQQFNVLTAMAVAETFLRMNGMTLKISEEKRYNELRSISRSERTLDQVISWFSQHAG